MAHSTPNYFSKHHNLRSGDAHSSEPNMLGGMFSPNRNTVKKILAYSKALEVKSSESIKNVMVILN
ncbi:hypothetical protein G3O08_02605 [Cryomorpha ignava]|uniref:Uncharacterized protein n=1 Tax=Cryomorpha ignava TaxID=101383 RepID=A0A7K3WNF3_9FLAO|nr:hypothetical protein [Cryomorpha ignava]NEN22392.1 hypothetical protein [Cryomorpha ignava]